MFFIKPFFKSKNLFFSKFFKKSKNLFFTMPFFKSKIYFSPSPFLTPLSKSGLGNGWDKFFGSFEVFRAFLRFKAFLGLVSFFEVVQKFWEIFAETFCHKDFLDLLFFACHCERATRRAWQSINLSKLCHRNSNKSLILPLLTYSPCHTELCVAK